MEELKDIIEGNTRLFLMINNGIKKISKTRLERFSAEMVQQLFKMYNFEDEKTHVGIRKEFEKALKKNIISKLKINDTYS